MPQFDVSKITDFAAATLGRVGASPEDAALTARSLVVANQRGTHSHGLLRLPLYIRAIQQGGIDPTAEMTWVSERGATALLDAAGGLGQVAAQRAVDKARDIAAVQGAAVVVVQSSSHFGAGSFWADQLVAAGCFAIVTSSTGPVVAPYGSGEKVLGTNPLVLAAPASGEEALIADFATSAGAYGKVIAARNAGTEIPEGWAVGPNGESTTDPNAAVQGALTTFGGHKGSALAVALEAFSSALGRGTFAFETEDIWDNPGSRMNIGHLFVAIHTDFFTGRAYTENRVTSLVQRVRASGEQVLAPGDPEVQHARRQQTLVEIPAEDANALLALADELQIAAPGPES